MKKVTSKVSYYFIAAVWDKSATLALLSLYEVKKDMLDNPKKKPKSGKVYLLIYNKILAYRYTI